MSEHTLSSIKRDSIRRVYDCISNTDCMTRLEISNITGLSLMTVGKIADALLEKDLILLEKSNSAKIGRRSECIRLNRSCAVIVIGKNEVSIVNTALEVGEKAKFKDPDQVIKFLIDNSLKYKYIGVGAISDAEENICESIKSLFGFAGVTVLDEMTAKAVNAIMSLRSENKTGLYIYADRNITRGMYFDDKTTVDGISLGELHGNTPEELIFSMIAVSKFLNTNEIYLHSSNNTFKASEFIKVTENDTHLGVARAVIDSVINITKRL